MSLAAVIIAKNADHTIARCLKSVSFADEIILVDSGSDDQTIKIAQHYGAKIIHNEWPGYGPQKNFGASHAQSDWLLFLDADEEVSPQLQNTIKAITDPYHKNHTAVLKEIGSYSFYWIRIITIFLGHPMPHLFGHNARLYKKGTGSWTDTEVHEQVQDVNQQIISLGDTNSGTITDTITHYSHTSIASYLKIMHQYTTLDANQMQKSGRHRSGRKVYRSILLPIKLAGRQFIKLLIYRRGILDGYAGFIWCLLSAYYEYEMGVKYNSKLKTHNSKP